jgi:hypothetical protein
MKVRLAWLVPWMIAAGSLQAAAEPRPSPRPAVTPRGRDAGARAIGAHVVSRPAWPVHIINNPPHRVIYHNARTNRDESHVVVIDRRPARVIDRDPHVRVIHRGYRSPHHWEHFHPIRGGWEYIWGIPTWAMVGTVTCEAANESTGELYPVSEDRDEIGWNDPLVNSVLDQALDDCMAEAGPSQCVPATPACTFQSY